jgi:hypothetical protein
MNRSMHLGGRLLAAVLAWAALVSAARADASPVALVTDVVGDARNAGEPLQLLSELAPGRELALDAQATVVVFYFLDGTEWTLRGPGRFRLLLKGPEAQAGAPAVERKAGPPAYREIKLRADRVQQGGIVMRSGQFDLPMTPVTPIAGEVVVAPEVRFAWRPLDDTARYQFELIDQTGQKVFTAETTDSALALPGSILLKPGQVYYWTVRGRAANAAQPVYRMAEFRVADAATRRRVEAARPKPDAPFSERALFVALLEEVGARTAAARQRLQLAPERPVAWASQ